VTSRYRAVSITAILVVVIAIAASVAVWFRASQNAEAVPQDRLGPVLLVPGRVADSVALVDLQKRLFLTGRRALIISVSTDDTGDLRAQAKQIQRTATSLIESGAPSVDVVGYGGGGVVTRLWLADGGAALTRRVVTIGTPNQGVTTKSQLANLVTPRFCATTCPQLTAGSAVLKSLPTDATGTAPWTNIWTKWDKTVAAPSAHLPGALNISLTSVCAKNRPLTAPATAHSDLPVDPLTVGIVLKALDNTPLTTAPTKADCNSLRQNGAPNPEPNGAAAT
jgi:triacylglycerol lipase